MKSDNFRESEWCAQCGEQPHETSSLIIMTLCVSFCDDCYQEYYWTCPECQRGFWLGFNIGIIKSRHHGPRHFIELDELDHRNRRKT